MESPFVPFIACTPHIREHNVELFGRLHGSDIRHNYWEITFTNNSADTFLKYSETVRES
jgi:hypothetical protein